MSLPPPPATPPPTPVPAHDVDVHARDRVIGAVGLGLVLSALVFSAVYTRADGDIDWSNYLIGFGATVLLGAIAALALVKAESPADELLSWPGAGAIVGVGVLLGIALDEGDATSYIVGFIVAGLSIAAYWRICGTAFALTAMGGLALVYGQVLSDLFDATDIEGNNFGIALGLGLGVFVAGITLAGWRLPSRIVTSLVAGVGAVFGIGSLLTGLGITASFQMAFSDFDMETGEPIKPEEFTEFHNDAWVILFVALALIALWAWCSWRTGHLGFRLLIVAMLVQIFPLVTFVLSVGKPSVWGLVILLAGAAVLATVAVRWLTAPPIDAQ